MPDLEATIQNARTVAVVGCSPSAMRTSHKIAKYLQQEAGLRVIPVNPHAEEILGEPCYPDLPSVPEDVQIDIVDIFRAPQHTAEMVRSALERIRRTGERPTIWTQLGVSSPEAELLAQEAGLPYVKNRCLMVEHARRVDAPS